MPASQATTAVADQRRPSLLERNQRREQRPATASNAPVGTTVGTSRTPRILRVMLWVIGPNNLTLSTLSTGSGAAFLALSTAYTRPARGAAAVRALGFVTLCVGARVLPAPVCPPALDHVATNPPSLTAYSFRLCHEAEVFHSDERERDPELIAYALRVTVAASTGTTRETTNPFIATWTPALTSAKTPLDAATAPNALRPTA
jgi:hypothetical protein